MDSSSQIPEVTDDNISSVENQIPIFIEEPGRSVEESNQRPSYPNQQFPDHNVHRRNSKDRLVHFSGTLNLQNNQTIIAG